MLMRGGCFDSCLPFCLFVFLNGRYRFEQYAACDRARYHGGLSPLHTRPAYCASDPKAGGKVHGVIVRVTPCEVRAATIALTHEVDFVLESARTNQTTSLPTIS